MFFKCHNCASGMNMGNFLRARFPAYYEQYIVERYKSNTDTFMKRAATTTRPVRPKPVQQSPILVSTNATKISDLPPNHFARQYVEGRKIPPKFSDALFYTDSFDKLVEDLFPAKYDTLQKNDRRLVIPFYGTQGDLLGLQGRSFAPDSSLRYITIRATDQTKLIFGLERLDLSRRVYVVEGPIDSFFLPNCIAAANSNLLEPAKYVRGLGATDVVLVPDRQPRNREIVALIEKFAESGAAVCLLPEALRGKDLNEMVLGGADAATLHQVVDKFTFSGLTLRLELTKWRKV